jgi:SAM-dependent MidA family methyltransferase
MNGLRQILQQEISVAGVIPFSRFMELALYCPEYGYYYQPRTEVGRGGDFYTSVSVGSLFGELLAFQFAEWLPTDNPCLVEAGAHDGRLAHDILRWICERRPAMYRQIEYWIVEPISVRAEEQKRRLEEFADKVRWCETLSGLPAVHGIIFANELLDAFPVSRYAWDAKQRDWFEWGVGLDGEEFSWKRCSTGGIAQTLAQAGVEMSAQLLDVLPDGYTIDLSPRAADWWINAGRKLTRGKLFTIDYGLTAEDLLAPERSAGTLRAYYKHHVATDILANVGQQDITAHVNFTHLQKVGQTEGLQIDTFLSQEKFLGQIGQKAWSAESNFGDWTAERTRQFQTLTHPEHLGRNFKVLVMTRP